MTSVVVAEAAINETGKWSVFYHQRPPFSIPAAFQRLSFSSACPLSDLHISRRQRRQDDGRAGEHRSLTIEVGNFGVRRLISPVPAWSPVRDRRPARVADYDVVVGVGTSEHCGVVAVPSLEQRRDILHPKWTSTKTGVKGRWGYYLELLTGSLKSDLGRPMSGPAILLLGGKTVVPRSF